MVLGVSGVSLEVLFHLCMDSKFHSCFREERKLIRNQGKVLKERVASISYLASFTQLDPVMFTGIISILLLPQFDN